MRFIFLMIMFCAIAGAAEPNYPPVLPGNREVVTDKSDEFLKPITNLLDGVVIAKEAPSIDFMFYPGQNYKGNPWSAWGDSVAVTGKYYSSIGDHLAPQGNAFVFEYDPATKRFRQLVDVRKVLGLPDGHYTPGKIHSRLDIGDDGWLYFSTHRGSSRATTDQYHYKGDWIIRHNPVLARTEVVAHGPVPKHCIPAGILDPGRLIFYGGTAPANSDKDGIRFFAYDVRAGKVLCDVPDGPSRAMIFAKSTGRLYYTQSTNGVLMRYDPAKGGVPVRIDGTIGIRAATQETPQGIVYSVSQAEKGGQSILYAFDTRTEKIQDLGPVAVGSQTYVTSIDADPSGRYLYYVAGAHGGSEKDGSPVVQFDVQMHRKKVIAFLHPFYFDKYGCTLKGTFSSAVDPGGDKLYITWNNSRGTKVWDSVVLTVVHIPESERKP